MFAGGFKGSLSSVGRASPSHGGGRGFESLSEHQSVQQYALRAAFFIMLFSLLGIGVFL